MDDSWETSHFGTASLIMGDSVHRRQFNMRFTRIHKGT
jgi:hypothetical protein